MTEDAANPASLPQDKPELLARAQGAWSDLMQTVSQLTPEQMTVTGAGGWSAKDNLAHLEAWHQYLLRYHLGGEPPAAALEIDEATFAGLDEDGINAVLYARNRDRSLEDVLAGLRVSFEQVVAALESMTYAQLLRPRYSDDPQQRPVLNWVIGNTYEHYDEHQQYIQALVGE